MHYAELSQSILDRDKKEKSLISEQGANMCEHAWSSMDHHPKSWSSLSLQPASYSKGRSRADISAAQWENSLFSSSFSEIFSRKCKLPFHHVVNCILSCVLLCFSLSYYVLLQRASIDCTCKLLTQFCLDKSLNVSSFLFFSFFFSSNAFCRLILFFLLLALSKKFNVTNCPMFEKI